MKHTMGHHDELTYTYPRTWEEAVRRLPTQGQDARCIERHRAPLRLRLIDWLCRYGAVAMILGGAGWMRFA